MIQVVKPKSPEPEATLTFPFLDKMPESSQLPLPNLSSQGKKIEVFCFSSTCSAGPICSEIVFIFKADHFLYVDVPLAVGFARVHDG